MKYKKLADGDEVNLGSTYFGQEPVQKVMCCDCGLVHHIRYRVVKGDLLFTAWRDQRATAARRRRKAKA